MRKLAVFCAEKKDGKHTQLEELLLGPKFLPLSTRMQTVSLLLTMSIGVLEMR